MHKSQVKVCSTRLIMSEIKVICMMRNFGEESNVYIYIKALPIWDFSFVFLKHICQSWNVFLPHSMKKQFVVQAHLSLSSSSQTIHRSKQNNSYDFQGKVPSHPAKNAIHASVPSSSQIKNLYLTFTPF